MAIVKATFFLPVRDNDGRSLRAGIQSVEDSLLFALKGYTRTKRLGGEIDPSDATPVGKQYLGYWVWIDEEKLDRLKEILLNFEPGSLQQHRCYFADSGGYMDFL